MMTVIWGVLGFIAAALVVREIAAYLPTIARWQINRGLKRLPEEMRAEAREKWIAIELKLPGDVSKVLWGVGCNWVLAPQITKTANPDRVAKIVHAIFFYVYLKIVAQDFIRLQFASPRQLRLRWLFLKMFADQAVVANNPNAPQPLLEFAGKLQRLAELKQEVDELKKNLWSNKN